MSDDLAAILDDISLHIEREISKVPPPVARALLRDDSPFSTMELLRILAQPEKAADLVGVDVRAGATQTHGKASPA
jgi:hypothetical protein